MECHQQTLQQTPPRNLLQDMLTQTSSQMRPPYTLNQRAPPQQYLSPSPPPTKMLPMLTGMYETPWNKFKIGKHSNQVKGRTKQKQQIRRYSPPRRCVAMSCNALNVQYFREILKKMRTNLAKSTVSKNAFSLLRELVVDSNPKR